MDVQGCEEENQSNLSILAALIPMQPLVSPLSDLVAGLDPVLILS